MRTLHTERVTRRAMNCDFEIIAGGEDPDRVAYACHEALDEVERAECILSRFIETSDVGRINAAAAGQRVRVSPETIAALDVARRVFEASDGAFDVTAGPLTRLWRDARQAGRVPGKRRIRESLARVGMHHVHFEAGDCTVWCDRPGMEIDLGAVGKGLGVDRAMEILVRYGVTDAAVCGAASSMRVVGTAPGSPPGCCGWSFHPRNPIDTGREVAGFRLRKGAVAMSAQHEQKMVRRGEVLGHVIDPRTGWPVPARFATLVIAPTAVEADALSTAILVAGPDRASSFARVFTGVGVAFIECGATPDETRLTWVVRSEGLPAESEPYENVPGDAVMDSSIPKHGDVTDG